MAMLTYDHFGDAIGDSYLYDSLDGLPITVATIARDHY